METLEDSDFNIEQAAKILEEKNKDKREEIPSTFQKLERPDGLPMNLTHPMQERGFINLRAKKKSSVKFLLLTIIN